MDRQETDPILKLLASDYAIHPQGGMERHIFGEEPSTTAQGSIGNATTRLVAVFDLEGVTVTFEVIEPEG